MMEYEVLDMTLWRYWIQFHDMHTPDRIDGVYRFILILL